MLHPAGIKVEFSLRRQANQHVDHVLAVPQVFHQADALVDQAGEDEALVGFLARHGGHARLVIVEVVLVTIGKRHPGQFAFHVEGPAVISALQLLHVALLRHAHTVAAMRTLVIEDVHAFFAAGEHHRLQSDLLDDEIAWFGHLALVADVHPAPIEDPLHLVIENGRRCVQRSVYAILEDQLRVVDVLRKYRGHDVPPVSISANAATQSRAGARMK